MPEGIERGREGGAMTWPQTIRRWRFLAEDENGDSAYVGSDFFGSEDQAIAEGDRRADEYEQKTGSLAVKVTRYTCGVQLPGPEAVKGGKP